MSDHQLDVEDLPLAQAGAGFRRGSGLRLLGLAAALIAGLLGLWLWLTRDDEARVYGELGRRLNEVRRADFDPFWQCVLEDVDVSSLHSNTELLRWLRSSVQAGGPDYAVHLRDDCLYSVSAIQPALDRLIAPPDLESDIAVLAASAGALERAFRAVIACLRKGEQACSEAQLQPLLQEIARAWFEFETAHAAINKTIRARLEKP